MNLDQLKHRHCFGFAIALHLLWPGLASAEQGAWSYALAPEVITGENWHPQASLASNNSLPLPAETKGTNIGYIGIHRKPQAPEEVVFSIERSLGELNCPPTGCVLQLSVDGGAPVNFLAEEHHEVVRGKSHRMKQDVRLKNAPSFIEKVTNAKRISVTFHSKINGAATLHFSAAQPLRFPANLKRLNS